MTFTANVMATHLMHCWRIFLLPANIQVCRRCSEVTRSMAEASVTETVQLGVVKLQIMWISFWLPA